jgi:hypothetical protein
MKEWRNRSKQSHKTEACERNAGKGIGEREGKRRTKVA